MRCAHKIVNQLLENEDDVGAEMQRIMGNFGGPPTTTKGEHWTAVKFPNGRELRTYTNGTIEYLLNGKTHREDGPASVDADGTKKWWLNGKLHREDGPAVERPNGTRVWCLDGKRHRVGGPAHEFPNGTKIWYLHGEFHREDGPAIEQADGQKEWYLHDRNFTEEEHAQRTRNR